MTQPPASIPCKICGTSSPFFDRCDFHANAKMHFGFHDAPINPSGLMLDYHRCPACGFMFTPFMDKWGDAEFRTYVYNKDYAQIDGTFHGYRAGLFANIFTLAFYDSLKQLDFLDYGGGFGLQSVMLRAFGAHDSATYDPHAAQKSRPQKQFDFVSAIEVLEHSTNPKDTIADMMGFLKPDGLLFITTELQPPDIAEKKCGWWYCNPRVGHISFSSHDSLRRLIEPYSMKLAHIGTQAHIAYRGQWPLWAERLLPPHCRVG